MRAKGREEAEEVEKVLRKGVGSERKGNGAVDVNECEWVSRKIT